MRGFGSIITTVMGGMILLAMITTLPRLMSGMQDVTKQASPAPAGPPPPATPVDMTTVAIAGVIALAIIVAGATPPATWKSAPPLPASPLRLNYGSAAPRRWPRPAKP